MATIETVCTTCNHNNVCRYKDILIKVTSDIHNKIQPPTPAIVDISCQYYKREVANPRTQEFER